MKSYTVTTTTDKGPPTETVLYLPELGDPCAKCGLNPSTREVTIMVEHSGGTAFWCDACAKGPEWTSVPPKAPGVFWARKKAYSSAELVDVFEEDCKNLAVARLGDSCVFGLCEFALWWPVRIQEPPQ